MGLFGCRNHHWGDYIDGSKYQINSIPGGKVELKKKAKAYCQHDGCNAEKTIWRTVGSCNRSTLEKAVEDNL